MKLALLVYLASIVEGASLYLGMLSFISLCVVLFTLCLINFSGYGVKEHTWESDNKIEKQQEVRKSFNKYSKVLVPTLLLTLILSSLLPKEKTIYIMAGAYITEEIVTNPRVQKIGNDVLEVVESKLSEMKGDDSKTTEDKPSK